MQENVILCLSGIIQKTKHFYSITPLWKIAKKKILGIVKDDKLNFKSQEVNYVKWLLRKLQLCYLHNSEKKIIFNSMVKSQFIAL